MLALVPDHVVTAPGAPVPVTPLANDSGDGLVLVGWTEPARGSLTPDGAGGLVYTPEEGFSGEDAFEVTARDALGDEARSSVRVSVVAPNSAPVANDDAAATLDGRAVDVDVLANDADPEGRPLSLLGLTSPGRGVARALPDGSVRYLPQPGFVGVDRFSYVVRDAGGATAVGAVTVSVSAANLPPTANDDAIETGAGQPVTFDPLANDFDPEGGALALSAVTLPAQGALAVGADGSLTYTPAEGFAGADAFTYQARDAEGKVATARVDVAVRRLNAPPAANDDAASTEQGRPVLVDVLANDSDPDGDPLALAGLEMPSHGTLALDASGAVRYAPEPGFVGVDSFGYTVSDGRGGLASARATVGVEAPPAVPFANGFAVRRRLAVPARGPDPVSLDGFVLLVDEAAPWLRHEASGGRVASLQGFDLRFEDASGAKLPHEVEAYDPDAGRLLAWVRLPSWRADEDLSLHLYAGKPGLAETEAEPAAVWADYLAVWDARTGLDRTGRGRGLAPSGVGEASLIGEAGRFDGSAVASGTGAAWWGGHAAVTAQAWVDADAAAVGTDRGFLSQGPITGSDADQGLVLRFDRRGAEGGGENVVLWEVKTDAGNTRAESPALGQRAGPLAVAGTWKAGEAPKLYLDGQEAEPSNAPAAKGSRSAAALGGVTLGAAAKDSAAGGWLGAIDEVRLRAGALPAAWLEAEHANAASPRAFYGASALERPGEAPAPLALPLRLSVEPGGRAALALDLPAGVTATAVGPAARGLSSLFAGKVNYAAPAGFEGTDGFSYTVSDASGRASEGFVAVEVARAAAETGGQVKNPPSAARVVPVSGGSALESALASARPGDHVVLADGEYRGSFVLARAGAAGAPVVVRAANPGKAVIKSTFSLPSRFGWLHQLTFDVGKGVDAVRIHGGDDHCVTRCRFTHVTAVSLKDGASRNKIGWNAFEGMDWPNEERNAVRIDLRSSEIGKKTAFGNHVYRNLFRSAAMTSRSDMPAVYVGLFKMDAYPDCGTVVEHNLFDRLDLKSAIRFKSNGNVARFNTAIGPGLGTGSRNTAMFSQRHGRRNVWEGNWAEKTTGFKVSESDHVYLGNRASGGAGFNLMAGSSTINQEECARTLMVGNRGDADVGVDDFRVRADRKAKDNRFEAHEGAVRALPMSSGTAESATASRAYPTARRLSVGEVGPEA